MPIRLVVALAVVLLLAIFGGGCPGPRPPALDPGGRGPAIPVPLDIPATPSASPSHYLRLAYALPPGPKARLWVYDLASQSVLVYPGAGRGIANVTEWNPEQFVYDDGRNIYLLDALREIRITLVEGLEVGGFAFAASFDAQDNWFFLGTADPELARRGIGWAYAKAAPRTTEEVTTPVATGEATGRATRSTTAGKATGSAKTENATGSTTSEEATESAGRIATESVIAPILGIGLEFPLAPTLGKPVFLTKINAVGQVHGGISSINVTGSGDWVAFTTADGGLYLYQTRRAEVQKILIPTGSRASAANIDPVWGRYLVWVDTVQQRVYCWDRFTGLHDTLPYLSLAPDAITVEAPDFIDNDPYNVVFLVTLPHGAFRLVNYNLLTELITNLTLLNMIPAY